MKLTGRRAVITGSSQGFGFAVARAFLDEGAQVMLCARNADRLRRAQQKLAELAGDESRVLATPADVSVPGEVQRLVEATVAGFGGLDILVSNAGVHGPKGPVQEVSWEEWRQALEINLLGTVLLCRAALAHFLRRNYGKILLLSGGGATKPMPYLSAYAASKAAIVRFGETLAEEVRASGIDVNSVAPGAMNTRLLDDILEAGPERVGRSYYQQALRQQAEGGTPLERGASLCVFLASQESDGITGKLISAVWDPWDSLPRHLEDLKGSDIYTLRRIVPSDRGKEWG
ncbi:MAG TPA: SDR family oxidoreductase [Gemmatimonadales bacterium]|nr:SDR family oxidoreductase [Gemmatimonadales bacterium]